MEGSIGDLQELVMERDGKFEVLSSVDLQAEQAEAPEQLHTKKVEELEEIAETRDRSQKSTQCIELPDNQLRVAGDTTEIESNFNDTTKITDTDDKHVGESESASKAKEDESTNKDTNSAELHPLETKPDATRSDICVPMKSEVAFESNDQAGLSQPNRQPLSAECAPVARENNSTSLAVLDQPLVTHEVKPKQQIRTKSAPASRSTKLAIKKEAEEREKRKQLSDAAFSAWLSRKNNEVIEKRKEERARLGCTAEDEQKKKEQCDLVYQNWLEAKNKQWKNERARERVSRPSTSVPKRDEERCHQAFESWMKKKHTQHLEEIKKEQMKSQELEDAAKRADPSVIEKAYKEWLVRKREQAKEEASKKEHYRKLYFSQPRQLKKHTAERFGGY